MIINLPNNVEFKNETFEDFTYILGEEYSFYKCTFGKECILPSFSFYEMCDFGEDVVILNNSYVCDCDFGKNYILGVGTVLHGNCTKRVAMSHIQ